MGDPVDHGGGRPLLPALAVDGQPHPEVLRVLDVVAGDVMRVSQSLELVIAGQLKPQIVKLEQALSGKPAKPTFRTPKG